MTIASRRGVARRRVIAFALPLVLAACGLPRNAVVLLPDESGTVGRVIVRGGGQEADLSAPYAAVGTSEGAPPGRVFVAERDTVERTFAGALAATPRAPQIFIIGFVNGTADIDPASRGTLAQAIAAAKATANADISVVGHADATGAESVNRPLSLQRATVVRDALVAGGVAADIIDVGYHGSSNPRIPRPRGVPEPANRRVEITIR